MLIPRAADRSDEHQNVQQPISVTIADLARAVPKGAQLQLQEASLDGLRRQRSTLCEEQRDLIAKYHGSQHAGASQAGRRVNELQAEIATLESKIATLRQDVAQLRAARAEKVLLALAPTRAAAARDLLAAIALLTKSAGQIAAIAEEVRRAGDTDQPYMRVPDLDGLESLARRCAEG